MQEVGTRKIANSIYSMEQLTPKLISSTIANNEIGLRILTGKLKVRGLKVKLFPSILDDLIVQPVNQ